MLKVKLSDIAFIKMGQSPQGETCNEFGEGIPLLNGPTEFTDFYPIPKQYTTDAKKLCDVDEILFCVRGSTTGRMNWSNSLYAIGRGLAAISHKNGKDLNYFLKYLIQYNLDSILRTTNGSTFPNLTSDMLASYEFIVPELIKQKKISTFLSSIDSKIELNNRINAELEAMAKTLYDYWFVQFDFPNANGKPYKTSGGKMVWSEKLKREVPDSWEVVKMSEWINIDKSGDWGKEKQEGNFSKKVTCIRGADINGLNGLTELKPPTRYILENNSFKILKSHDLIIEISGGSPTQSTGRLAFITDATIKRFDNPLICSNFCKPISIKNKKLLYNFVYYWNSLYDNGVFFGYEGKTSGIKNLLLDTFVSSYYTVVPEEKIVNQFYNLMENLQNKKQTTLAENQKLAEHRDWLLPMLMNWQVKVN